MANLACTSLSARVASTSSKNMEPGTPTERQTVRGHDREDEEDDCHLVREQDERDVCVPEDGGVRVVAIAVQASIIPYGLIPG